MNKNENEEKQTLTEEELTQKKEKKINRDLILIIGVIVVLIPIALFMYFTKGNQTLRDEPENPWKTESEITGPTVIPNKPMTEDYEEEKESDEIPNGTEAVESTEPTEPTTTQKQPSAWSIGVAEAEKNNANKPTTTKPSTTTKPVETSEPSKAPTPELKVTNSYCDKDLEPTEGNFKNYIYYGAVKDGCALIETENSNYVAEYSKKAYSKATSLKSKWDEKYKKDGENISYSYGKYTIKNKNGNTLGWAVTLTYNNGLKYETYALDSSDNWVLVKSNQF